MASILFSFPRTLPLTLTDDMFFQWNSDPEHTVTRNWIPTSTPLLLTFSPSLVFSPSSSFLLLSLSVCTEGHAVNFPFSGCTVQPSCQVNPLLPWVRQPVSLTQMSDGGNLSLNAPWCYQHWSVPSVCLRSVTMFQWFVFGWPEEQNLLFSHLLCHLEIGW